MTPIIRSRLLGATAILEALREGAPVRMVLVARSDQDETTQALRDEAVMRGVELWQGSEGDLRRMSPETQSPASALALLGPPLVANLQNLLARGGVTWLLHRAAYPSNVGFCIRTAEVSGADGVIVDAAEFNREQRSRVSHVAMGADRVMPVLWQDSNTVVAEAKNAALRIIAIEDVGAKAPHQVDLTGPLLLVVGNEREGIAPWLLDACDNVVRIPMAGFVPSYSLQAAVSAVAVERMRQLATRACDK